MNFWPKKWFIGFLKFAEKQTLCVKIKNKCRKKKIWQRFTIFFAFFAAFICWYRNFGKAKESYFRRGIYANTVFIFHSRIIEQYRKYPQKWSILGNINFIIAKIWQKICTRQYTPLFSLFQCFELIHKSLLVHAQLRHTCAEENIMIMRSGKMVVWPE